MREQQMMVTGCANIQGVEKGVRESKIQRQTDGERNSTRQFREVKKDVTQSEAAKRMEARREMFILPMIMSLI